MIFSDWSVVAEIVSAIGIIVTLIYLAVQVHGNTRQKEFFALQSAIIRFLDAVDQVTRTKEEAEIFRNGLNHFAVLSAKEQGAFHSQMHSLLHGFHSIWILYKAGVLPEYELVAMRRLYVEFLLSPGGQGWWKEFKHIPPPHLVEYLDQETRNASGVITPAIEKYSWLRADEDNG